MAWLLQALQGSPLDIAQTVDEGTLSLQILGCSSLLSTPLTVPFLLLLESELERRGIAIRLGRASP